MADERHEQQIPPEERVRRYATAYLRGYQKMARVLLPEEGISYETAAEHLPLLSGILGESIHVALLCDPYGAWVAFSPTPLPIHTHLGAEDGHDRDYVTYTPHEEQMRRILSKVDTARSHVYVVERIPSPGAICQEFPDWIEGNAESHGRSRSQQDVAALRFRITEHEKAQRWNRAVDKVKRARAAAGTAAAGYDFQEGIHSALEIAGCEPREVAIKGQQIDASCWIAGHFVLVEATNSKDPADVSEVADVMRKLMARPAGIVGLLIAPAGFTAGVMAEVSRNANRFVILTWGHEDLEEILKTPDRLGEYFLARYRDFVDSAGTGWAANTKS